MSTILGVVAVFLALCSIAQTAELEGRASIVDADTIRFSVRFQAIDAPELRQQCQHPDGTCWPCGQRARDALRQFVKRKHVQCTVYGLGKYGRYIGTCYADDIDISLFLLQSGWAIPVEKYLDEVPHLREPYHAAYEAAKQRQLGIHVGPFIAPHLWRNHQRLACQNGQ